MTTKVQWENLAGTGTLSLLYGELVADHSAIFYTSLFSQDGHPQILRVSTQESTLSWGEIIEVSRRGRSKYLSLLEDLALLFPGLFSEPVSVWSSRVEHALVKVFWRRMAGEVVGYIQRIQVQGMGESTLMCVPATFYEDIESYSVQKGRL